MSRRQFTSHDNAELRAKIDEAKQILPLPDLMRRLGYDEKHIGKTALCPFHDDQRPSLSVFQGNDGFWHYNCFACDTQGGDEIAFLVKHFGISRREAIKRYLELAGFPTRRPSESREYPACPVSPVFPECPVSPVSEGQAVVVHGVVGELRAELKAIAARNACTRGTRPEDSSWQLARELAATAKRISRKLSVVELMITFDEWHRLSLPFLDPGKTRDLYWMSFLAQLQKVRVPMGEGRIAEALEYVSTLTEPELPILPGYGNALAPRKLIALHRELSRRSTKKDRVYFLSYRDAAKVCDGLSHQEAHTITFALASVGVIEIVSNGKSGVNSREAAEFRYLLPPNENGAEEDDGGLDY